MSEHFIEELVFEELDLEALIGFGQVEIDVGTHSKHQVGGKVWVVFINEESCFSGEVIGGSKTILPLGDYK